MSKPRKYLFLAFSILVLGGVAFAATQSSWLKGDANMPGLGDDDDVNDVERPGGVDPLQASGPDLNGGGSVWDVGGETGGSEENTDPFNLDNLNPGGFGGGPTGGTGTTTETNANIYISVVNPNGDFLDGLTEDNFSGTSFESFEEKSDYYHFEVASEGTHTISASVDGYITTDDSFTSTVADDVVSIQSLELPYSYVVTVVDEDGDAITGATVTVMAGQVTSKTCTNYESNKYGCASTASKLTKSYTVTKSGYETETGSFKTEYTASSKTSVTATVTLTAVVVDDDADNDGLKDTEEVALGTDPNDYDTDDDTLTDYAEAKTGGFGTDPLKADTDDDGLNDNVELAPAYEINTDPLDADSDEDLISDGDEVNTYDTDPNNADTDGGSVSDGTEVYFNITDPNDASDDVALPSEDSTADEETPTETTTSYSCSAVSISPSTYELDADLASQDITFSVTVRFSSQVAQWQKSLISMVSLASTETWSDNLVLGVLSKDGSYGAGTFEDDDTGMTGNPLTVALTTDDGTAITTNFSYTSAQDGDEIRVKIQGEPTCKDSLTITQAASSSSSNSSNSSSSSSSSSNSSSSTSSVTADDTTSTYTTTLDTILRSESYNCSDSFTDTTGNWAEDIVCRMFQADIVEGKVPPYTFSPNGDVTNAEAMKMIVGLLLEKDTGDAYGLTEGFTDVTNSDWFSDWIKLAEDEDVARTRDFGGYFFPNQSITRGQLAVYIARALGLTTYSYSVDFTDVDHDDYYAYAIALLSDEDKTTDVPYDDSNEELPVIEGYSDNTFHPTSNVSRAEALTMIYRAYLIYKN